MTYVMTEEINLQYSTHNYHFYRNDDDDFFATAEAIEYVIYYHLSPKYVLRHQHFKIK